MMDGWKKNIHNFYTPGRRGGTCSTSSQRFEKGKMVLNIAEMPIKWPRRAPGVPVPGGLVLLHPGYPPQHRDRAGHPR